MDGLNKNKLENELKSHISNTSLVAFKKALGLKFNEEEPPELHVQRMAEVFAREMSQTLPQQLANEIDLYVRGALGLSRSGNSNIKFTFVGAGNDIPTITIDDSHKKYVQLPFGG